jgi:hypothetical protein
MDERTVSAQIMELTASNARMGAEIRHLALAVETLTNKMEVVTAYMQRDKGVMATIAAVCAAAGALIGHYLHKLFE